MRKVVIFLASFVGFFMVYWFLMGKNGIVDFYIKSKRLYELRKEKVELLSRKRKLEYAIRSLKSLKEQGLAKDKVIFRFKTPDFVLVNENKNRVEILISRMEKVSFLFFVLLLFGVGGVVSLLGYKK